MYNWRIFLKLDVLFSFINLGRTFKVRTNEFCKYLLCYIA